MRPVDVGAPELEAVARVLAEEAGLSLASGLRGQLRDGLLAAAAERGEVPARLAARVAAREPDAIAAVVERAAVAETSFWRHPEQLLAVGRWLGALPLPVTAWCAGCATGEEAYSLAIALLEAGRGFRADRIVGTDVSRRALAVAGGATYAPRALRKLPADAAQRWLDPAGADGMRRVRPEVRARVAFAPQNLVRDPPPEQAPFDLILCRNVLIYFEPPVAGAVLYRLVAALKPGGALVLGPVELPIASALPVEWVRDGEATLLVKRDV
jgi:chemotaxis protein methyltransferase CheR